jgi:uncharacterized membrane protein YidH (DUF202 family)
MATHPWRLAIVATAASGAALAADMFQAAPGNESAARGVALLGAAICLFCLSLSVGALVAGIWRAIHQSSRSRRRIPRRRLGAI